MFITSYCVCLSLVVVIGKMEDRPFGQATCDQNDEMQTLGKFRI